MFGPSHPQLKSRGAPMDIFLSHDWPLGIEQHGDTGGLIREKPFFKQEVRRRVVPLACSG